MIECMKCLDVNFICHTIYIHILRLPYHVIFYLGYPNKKTLSAPRFTGFVIVKDTKRKAGGFHHPSRTKLK